MIAGLWFAEFWMETPTDTEAATTSASTKDRPYQMEAR
jgi:hypothetical protein